MVRSGRDRPAAAGSAIAVHLPGFEQVESAESDPRDSLLRFKTQHFTQNLSF
jgi:hypothetical protein